MNEAHACALRVMWRCASCCRNLMFKQTCPLEPIERSQCDTLCKCNRTTHQDLLQIGENRDGDPYYNVDGKNLLQYNARSHAAIHVLNFLVKRRVTVLHHPPYSADLVYRFIFVSPLSARYERPAISMCTGNSTMCDIDASSSSARSLRWLFSAALQSLSKARGG